MKKFLYFGLVFVLVGVSATVIILYYRLRGQQSEALIFRSHGRQWILSGENHLFDVTERTFNLVGLFGFKEGFGKWAPLGGEPAKTPFSPHFIPASKTSTMTDDEYVIGVVSGGVATAYPLKIIARHQVVNDSTRETPVMVYFGNTSRTAAAFGAEVDGKTLNFGCTGYLYRNVDLIFDTSTESLFLPLTGMFVAGERLGERLALLPSVVIPLGQWRALYPESRLMAESTGVTNVRYPRREVLAEPLSLKALPKGPSVEADFTDEAPVIAVADGWESVVIALPKAKSGGKDRYTVAFKGRRYQVRSADGFESAWVTGSDDELAPAIRSIWKVYRGLLPESEIADLE